jgi:hypothetical protein
VKKGNSYTIKIPIISGEREWHGKSAKINQTNEALNVYQGIAKHFGVQLLLPLRHIAEGDRIAEILGFEWQEGKEQLGCVLSKNYRLLDGGTCGTASQIQRYLEEFASPCAKEIIKSYTVGHVPNHLDIAAQVLGSPGISPSTKLKG